MKRIWAVAMLAVLAGSALIPVRGWAQVQSFGVTTWTYLWTDSTAQDNFWCVAVKNGMIFGGTDSKYLQKSTDMGKHWSQKDARNGLNLSGGYVDALVVTASGDLLVGNERGIYKSTDDGENWRKVDQGSLALFVTKKGIVFSGSANFISSCGMIRKSTDNGETWTVAADSVFTSASGFTGFAETPSGVLLASTSHSMSGYSEGIFRSTDGGKTWVYSNTGLTDKNIQSIAANRDGFVEWVYVATELDGFFKSEDGGLSWKHIDEITEKYGGCVFMTQVQGTFFGNSNLKRDPIWQLSGSTYRPLGGPVGYMVLSGCQYDLSHILFGTHNGLWMATFSNPTKVEDQTIPTSCTLFQNYPNPFNPSTTIKFSLPHREYVNLTIYNMIGQKVETLVDETKDAGSHQIVWNAGNKPSGIYFARLATESGFKSSVKMLLVK